MERYIYISVAKGKQFERPNCWRCGDCCTRIPPELLPEEVEFLKRRLRGNELKLFLSNLTTEPREANPFDHPMTMAPLLPGNMWLKAPCMFLTTEQHKGKQLAECIIYKIRPRICRIFWCGKENKDEPLLPTRYTYRWKLTDKEIELG